MTPADVHSAATAPDARQRLGNVRAGSLHALEAYRFLSAKQQKKGSLSPEEEGKLERAKQALAEAVGKGRQGTTEPLAAGGMERPVDAHGNDLADSSAASAPPRDAITPRDEDVHAAATAPDARQQLGSVRAGSLHALEAYRYLSEKQKKKGSLSPEEQEKLERAKGALAEEMGREEQMRRSTFDSDEGGGPAERRGIAGNLPDAIQPSNRPRGPAQGESIDDPEEGSYLSERHGKRLKKALHLPPDASAPEKIMATQLILDEINRKSRYRSPQAMGGGPLMRGIKRPELFNTELTLTPEERLIAGAPHEIVAVFGPDGRLKKAVSKFERHWSSIPELDGPGHVVTHQHPSGLPPSFMDLVWLIGYNPTQIHRTIAGQKNGSTHLFEMKVNEPMNAGEIEAAKLAYKRVVGSNPDTFETRMLAISAAMSQSNGKLQVNHGVKQ